MSSVSDEHAGQHHWYLLIAKANQDQRAEENLCNQGYVIYRPMARIPKVRRSKREYRLESLFPRYLFIWLNPINDNWAPIRSTYGVSGFVKFGLYPSIVPDELVAFIKTNEKDYERLAVDIYDIQQHDSVEILAGAFKGCEGIFHKFDGEQRAIVLLNFLGQQRTVKVPSSLLRAIS